MKPRAIRFQNSPTMGDQKTSGTKNIRTRISILLIFAFLPIICFSQNSLVDSLREELRKANLMLKSSRNQADRLDYLLTAKEMALRSIELHDSVFQALVAIQAYKFNREHNGNPTDIDSYRALYKALERFADPMTQRLPKEIDKRDKDFTTKTDAMANQLCFRIKRNMTIEEWKKFSGHLMYETTCGTFQPNTR